MNKLVLLLILGCLLRHTALADTLTDTDAHTNTVDKLKVLYNAFIDAAGGWDFHANPTNEIPLAKLREEVGLFVGTLCGSPDDTHIPLAASDDNVVEFTYTPYISDLGYLQRTQRTQRGKEALSLKMIAHRVNSLVSAYPIASRSHKGERFDMTMFLAYASQTNSNDVRSAVKSRLKRLAITDQLPFLVALSELGDKGPLRIWPRILR